jgi:hypothetical protein
VRKWWPKGLPRYLLTHPADIPPVVLAGWRLRRVGWWRLPPFLPLPDEAYWAFRLSTVAGSEGTIQPRAVVEAARWAQRQRVKG